ncbi:MAG: hypothetical protein ABH824_01855 [Nanoarchaeota archaeon]
MGGRMHRLYKRADGGLTAVVIIVIILIFIGWLVSLGQRECKTNNECGTDQYCGSDFGCHPIPVIEKTNNVVQYDLKAPALIIGLAMIITAIILKWDKIKNGSKNRNSNKDEYVYYREHKHN